MRFKSRHLGMLYDDLAGAEEVLVWLEEHAGVQPTGWLQREGNGVLEGCGAVCARMHRWLHQHQPLVVLPKGCGLNEVVVRTHEQLNGRIPGAAE